MSAAAEVDGSLQSAGVASAPPGWSFEHAGAASLRNAARAAKMGVQPWRLWRDLKPEHPANASRLQRMVFLWVLAALLAIHLGLGVLWVPPWAPWHGTATIGEWVRAVVWPHGITARDFIHYTLAPLLSSALHGMLPMLLMGWGVVLTARVTSITPARGTVKRAIAYGMASGLVASVTFHLALYALSSAYYIPVFMLELLLVIVLVGYPIWLEVYWQQFAKHSLHLRYSLLHVVVVLVATIVVTAVVLVVFKAGIDWLYPSDAVLFEQFLEEHGARIEQRREERR